jgi:putative transposase
MLLSLIDAEYTAHPFYGTRKMVVILCNQGHKSTVSGSSV